MMNWAYSQLAFCWQNLCATCYADVIQDGNVKRGLAGSSCAAESIATAEDVIYCAIALCTLELSDLCR